MVTRFPTSMRDRLTHLAKEQGISRSELIRRCVYEYALGSEAAPPFPGPSLQGESDRQPPAPPLSQLVGRTLLKQGKVMVDGETVKEDCVLSPGRHKIALK